MGRRGTVRNRVLSEAGQVTLDSFGARYQHADIKSWDDLVLRSCDAGKPAEVGLGGLVDGDPLNDFEWYAANVQKIINKDARLVPLVLNAPQRQLYQVIKEEYASKGRVYVVVLKGRQHGISTLMGGFLEYGVVTTPYLDALIVAHNDIATAELFERVKRIYQHTPPELQPMLKRSNKKELRFMNPTSDSIEFRDNPGLQSCIGVQTGGSEHVGIGQTIHRAHISELPKWDKPEQNLYGLMQAIPDRSGVVVVHEFTAYGRNFGYDFWQAALHGQNDFRALFLGFQENPEYRRVLDSGWDGKLDWEEKWLQNYHSLDEEQLYWRRWTIRNKCDGNTDKFHQEYPVIWEQAFSPVGSTVFPIDGLKRQEGYIEIPRHGDLIGDFNSRNYSFLDHGFGQYHILEEPILGYDYCLGVDFSEARDIGGRETDKGAIVVIRRGIEPRVVDKLGSMTVRAVYGKHDLPCVVAIWSGVVPIDEAARVAVGMGFWYNYGWMNPENNASGAGAIHIMKPVYGRILGEYRFGKLGLGEQLTGNLGFRTSISRGTGGRGGSKAILISALVSALCGEYTGRGKRGEPGLICPFKAILDECYDFANNDGKMGAAPGKHDDLVMALGLAWFCHTKALKGEPGGMAVLSRKKYHGFRPMCAVTGY